MPTKSQSAAGTIPLAPAARPQFAFGNKTRKRVGKGLGAILSVRADNIKPQISYIGNLKRLALNMLCQSACGGTASIASWNCLGNCCHILLDMRSHSLSSRKAWWPCVNFSRSPLFRGPRVNRSIILCRSAGRCLRLVCVGRGIGWFGPLQHGQ